MISPAENVPPSFTHSSPGGKPDTPGDHTAGKSFEVAEDSVLHTSDPHGLEPTDRIRVNADDTLLPPMVVDTTYYVVASEAAGLNDFQISDEPGGEPLEFGDTGHGFNFFLAPEVQAEIDDFLTAMNSTGPAAGRGTYPASIAKIQEWLDYYASTEYLTWWLADQSARAAQYAASL